MISRAAKGAIRSPPFFSILVLPENDAGSLFVQGEHDGTFEEHSSLHTKATCEVDDGILK
jgi:hypothetical protein